MKHNIKQIMILGLMLVGNITAWATTKTITYTLTCQDPDFHFVLEGDNGDKYDFGQPTNGNFANPLTISFQDVSLDISSSDAMCHIGDIGGTSGFYGHGFAFKFESTNYYVTKVTVGGVDRMWYRTVEATNNSKSCTVNFPYDQVLINQLTVTLSDTKPLFDIANANVTHDIADSYVYTGSAITPAVTSVAFNLGASALSTLTLTEGTDYTVAYTNNTNAGTATVTVTGKGDYTGTWSKTFAINKASVTATAPTPVTTGYNGTAQTLCTGGSATGGTLMYSINNGSTWSTDVPTATNASTYNVYYRVVADQNHTDVEPTLAGTATINARQHTFGTITVTDGYTNSSNNTIVIADDTDNVTITEDVPNIGSITMQRTFTPGKAATVMLPFDIAVSKVSGGKFYGFIGVDKEGANGWEVLMLEVNRVSGTLQAHTPYLFMPSATQLTFNLGGEAVTLKANSQQTYTVQP